jgi:hypothetical protein
VCPSNVERLDGEHLQLLRCRGMILMTIANNADEIQTCSLFVYSTAQISILKEAKT